MEGQWSGSGGTKRIPCRHWSKVSISTDSWVLDSVLAIVWSTLSKLLGYRDGIPMLTIVADPNHVKNHGKHAKKMYFNLKQRRLAK